MEKENKIEEVALRLVNFRPRFSDELAWKLEQKNFETEEIQKIIAKFESLKVLDDKNLLPNFISSMVKNRRWSRRRIETKLYSLHLKKELITSALNSFFDLSQDTNMQNIQHLIQKKKSQLAHFDKQKKRQKIMQYLIARGFNYTEIKRALDMEKIEK